MTAATTPSAKTNLAGLEKSDYKGQPSTLCPGCGHDSVSARIIEACFELSIKPSQMIKLSGIGCSSKSPAYFLNGSHGINTVHGRMPSVATGALLANRYQTAIGVSGDGDTGSIGLGQFKHLVRRNVPMVYIIENNGVYGLTKGQFSATADQGQVLKYAGTNELPPLDLCAEAIIAGAGFVARSFAGDSKQVTQLLKAALTYNGIAVLDIISPCVTFNNSDDSTKSYSYGKEHQEMIHDISFVQSYDEIQVSYEEGEMIDVKLHDGPVIRLNKLSKGHDPRNRLSALTLLHESAAKNEFITGLLYIDESRPTLIDTEHMHVTPIAHLSERLLRPSKESLTELMKDFSY
jgi:2-oxoglutarate/2-oxoacid ferredoxin oxidoreductase subunit beta